MRGVHTNTAKYMHFILPPTHMHTDKHTLEYSRQEQQACGVCIELWNLDENETKCFSGDTQD